MKKTFIFYTDWIDYTDSMTLEEKWLLFQIILDYQNWKEVTSDNSVIRVLRPRIKKQLDENNEKWEEERKKRSKAGKKWMKSRWKVENESITNNNTVIKNITNITDNVNDNVNDNNILSKDNTTIVAEEKKEYIPKPQTLEINNLIEHMKKSCYNAWVVYAPDSKERIYAKHLLSKKFEKEAIEPLGITLNVFIERVLISSATLKYVKKIYNCKTMYYDWGDVVNKAIAQKQENKQRTQTSF